MMLNQEDKAKKKKKAFWLNFLLVTVGLGILVGWYYFFGNQKFPTDIEFRRPY